MAKALNFEETIQHETEIAESPSPEQEYIQSVFQTIAQHAIKSEVATWTRKRKSIERIITNNVRPLEDKIIELNAQLMPLYEQLTAMRAEMVEFCIHPIDMLSYKVNHVECKFCNRKLNVPSTKV